MRNYSRTSRGKFGSRLDQTMFDFIQLQTKGVGSGSEALWTGMNRCVPRFTVQHSCMFHLQRDAESKYQSVIPYLPHMMGVDMIFIAFLRNIFEQILGTVGIRGANVKNHGDVSGFASSLRNGFLFSDCQRGCRVGHVVRHSEHFGKCM